MTQTPEQIAASLTKAQREALLRMPMPFALETVMDGVVMLDGWVTATDAGIRGNTLASMNPLGGVNTQTLECGPILVTCDWTDNGKRIWKMTSTGLAVRAILEKNNG